MVCTSGSSSISAAASQETPPFFCAAETARLTTWKRFFGASPFQLLKPTETPTTHRGPICAAARDAPAAEIAEADAAADRGDPRQGHAARVGHAQDAAHACAGDTCDGDLLLFEHLEHAHVGKASGKAAPERQPDAA